MKRHDLRIDAARNAALVQRMRLKQRIGLTRERLRPNRLKFDAEQAVEQRLADGARIAVDSVKAHPLAAGAAALAVIGWTFRQPLLDHAPARVRGGWQWLAGQLGFTSPPSAGADAALDKGLDDSNTDDDPNPPPPPGAEQD